MFKFFKKNKPTVEDNKIVCRSGSELLANYDGELKMIYENLAVPEENFKQLYVKYLENVAFFIQSIPASQNPEFNHKDGLLKLCMRGGINALKKRKGFMLPPGVRSDLIDEQRSIWSYAIFTSSILIIIQNALVHCEIETSNDGKVFYKWNFMNHGIGHSKYFRARKSISENSSLPSIYGTFIFQHLLPKEGMIWLSSDDNVFKEWIGVVTQNKKHIDWLTPFSSQSCLFPTVGNEQVKNKTANSSLENKESTVKPTNNNIKDDTDQYALNLDNEKNDAVDDTDSDEDEYFLSDDENKMVDQFFDWAKKMIDLGDLQMNTNMGLVHSIEAGIFMVTPAVFNRYKDSKKLNKDIPKQLESLIMFKDEGLIQSDKKTNIHLLNAYNNELKGIIVSPEVLGLDEKPPLNKEFTMGKNVKKEADIGF